MRIGEMFTVISGMARGVDGIAGRAALDAGGDSYAVLGCGVDVVYPTENAQLYRLLREKGGILSEVPPGTQPRSTLFPMRNRLISGLSDAVLVIEAQKKERDGDHGGRGAGTGQRYLCPARAGSATASVTAAIS